MRFVIILLAGLYVGCSSAPEKEDPYLLNPFYAGQATGPHRDQRKWNPHTDFYNRVCKKSGDSWSCYYTTD